MPTKRKVQICKCGHSVDEHQICDCLHCPDGIHECFAKIKKGNNNDFCECQDYEEKNLTNPKRKVKK